MSPALLVSTSSREAEERIRRLRFAIGSGPHSSRIDLDGEVRAVLRLLGDWFALQHLARPPQG